MDSECRQLRRNSRRLERKYRRTGSTFDRLVWVEHERARHTVYRQKKRAFWNAQLTDTRGSQESYGIRCPQFSARLDPEGYLTISRRLKIF